MFRQNKMYRPRPIGQVCSSLLEVKPVVRSIG